MPNQVLVTYATRTGATAGVAEAIAQTLAESGVQAEALPMQQVTDLSLYQAVAAGSVFQGGNWLPEAMELVRTYRAELAQSRFRNPSQTPRSGDSWPLWDPGSGHW